MLEKQNSVAFEVDFGNNTTPATPPASIVARIQKFQEERLRRSISREDIDGKLYDAAEKKKHIEDERIAKATHEVAHAKKIASLSRQNSQENLDNQLTKIEDKLNAAADNKAEQERQRVSKLEEHFGLVQARKSGSQDAKPELLEADINDQLNAAETRRKALESSKVDKVALHLRHVEQVKVNAVLEQSQAKRQLNNKLHSAEVRRSKLEHEALQRLAKLHDHVEEVQRRKSQIAPAAY